MKKRLIACILALTMVMGGKIEVHAKNTMWVSAVNGLNVREYPVNGDVVGVLPAGKEIDILGVVKLNNGEYKKWYKIMYNNRTRYICADYCTNDHDDLYTQQELYELSHLIFAEVGDYSKKRQLAAGSVVLNRVKHWYYPDTIHDVIFQSGQYACTWDGGFYREPSKMAIESAKYLLLHGSTIPSNVVFQAEFEQGSDVYDIMGNTFFCYW